MASSRQLPRALVARGVPFATRLSLLDVAARRRFRPAPVYHLRFGPGRVPISHADYGVDWETMRTIVVDRAYALDYRGTVVVDVGAHKGCYGAFALQRGARAVLSFEPEATNHAYLEGCAARYRAAGRTWYVHRAAVGAALGSADLHVMGVSWGHALAPSEEAGDETGLQQVDVVPIGDVLDEAAKLAEGDRVVVKVNAEGAECEIVLESPLDAWKRVDTILLEVHSWAPCTLDDLASHLSRVGFALDPSGNVDWVRRLSREVARV